MTDLPTLLRNNRHTLGKIRNCIDTMRVDAAELLGVMDALIDASTEAVADVVPVRGLATHPCSRCGVRHSLGQFAIHERVIVIADQRNGRIVEWGQYGGPLWYRVEFDGQRKDRTNFAPCELLSEPF